MTIGTPYFVSFNDAVKYYRPYSFPNTPRAVQRKLDAGEIHIGKPTLKPGERLLVIDEGTRYAIQEPAK